jgi:hypothetical protein
VAENKARFFIFDVQTHHIAMPNQARARIRNSSRRSSGCATWLEE